MNKSSIETAIDDILSLPEELKEVSKMQNEQMSELTRQQSLCQQSETDIALKYEAIQAIIKKQCLNEDLSAQLREKNIKAELEIEKVINKIQQLQTAITLQNLESDSIKRKVSVQTQRMDLLKEEILQLENQNETLLQFKSQKNDTETLQKQIEDLTFKLNKKSSNHYYDCQLTDDLAKINISNSNLRKTLEEKNIQLQEFKEQQENIQQEIKVLHKRNTAQMIRLKRQIKEAKTS